MRIYTLSCELITQTSLEDTFSIFENPYNLARITPTSLGFEVTSKERVKMETGAVIDYTIRWLGLPIHWKTIIRDYQPPVLFIDEQAKGPYKLWRHRHTFNQTPEGTAVGDHVEYALPFGILGQIMHVLVVKRQLLEIFRYRQKELGKMLGTARQTSEPKVTG